MSKMFQTPRKGALESGPLSSEAAKPQRIGIFRRKAVVRYSGALDPQRPELLAPWPGAALILAVALTSLAALLLGLL